MPERCLDAPERCKPKQTRLSLSEFVIEAKRLGHSPIWSYTGNGWMFRCSACKRRGTVAKSQELLGSGICEPIVHAEAHTARCSNTFKRHFELPVLPVGKQLFVGEDDRRTARSCQLQLPRPPVIRRSGCHPSYTLFHQRGALYCL